jgi:nitrite reductase (cytochrome c-552)
MSFLEKLDKSPFLKWTIFISSAIIVFLLGLFASTIIERRSETIVLQTVKAIPEYEPRNYVWGQNYPREYETYRLTSDTTFASKHGGSITIDYLKKYPELVILWAGFPFSRDYKQGRGHYYSIIDTRNTLRTTAPLPSTCWTCKSTDVPRLMKEMGVSEFYSKKWKDLGAEVVNHIGCQDCHDPKTMNLRLTRPALVEALQRQGKDLSKITHQEMRSLVCAQCHVEYYFKGEGKYLTFPWDKGFSAEEMEAYFDEIKFADWTHALSKAPMLKAQHPDYELYMTGIHAKRGVACADCHMPYKVEGGIKFTDHHITSPLKKISASCQTCHKQSEAELMRDVYERQDRVLEMRRIAEQTLAKAHLEAKFAWEKGATEKEMEPVLKLLRSAQWRWDWVAASNGVSFHSPTESQRVLGSAIQKAEQARFEIYRILAKKGYTEDIPLPDYSTKEKAQEIVGLDIKKIKAEKEEFLNTLAKEWDKLAAERESKY